MCTNVENKYLPQCHTCAVCGLRNTNRDHDVTYELTFLRNCFRTCTSLNSENFPRHRNCKINLHHTTVQNATNRVLEVLPPPQPPPLLLLLLLHFVCFGISRDLGFTRRGCQPHSQPRTWRDTVPVWHGWLY